MAGFVDFESEIEDARNVFAGFGASDEYWCEWQKIEVALETVQNIVNFSISWLIGLIFMSLIGDNGSDWLGIIE